MLSSIFIYYTALPKDPNSAPDITPTKFRTNKKRKKINTNNSKSEVSKNFENNKLLENYVWIDNFLFRL